MKKIKNLPGFTALYSLIPYVYSLIYPFPGATTRFYGIYHCTSPPHISTVSHVTFRLACAQHSILVYLHTVAVSGVAFILFLFGPTLKPCCTHRRGKFLAVFLLPAKVSKVVCWKPVNNVAKDWICKAVTLSAFVLPSFVY